MVDPKHNLPKPAAGGSAGASAEPKKAEGFLDKAKDAIGGILGTAKDAAGGAGDFLGNLFKGHKGGIFGALGLGVITFMLTGNPIFALIAGLIGMFAGNAMVDNKSQQGAEHGGAGGPGRGRGAQRSGPGQAISQGEYHGITEKGEIVGAHNRAARTVVHGTRKQQKGGQAVFEVDAVALLDSNGNPTDKTDPNADFHYTLPMKGKGHVVIDENSNEFKQMMQEAPKAVSRIPQRVANAADGQPGNSDRPPAGIGGLASGGFFGRARPRAHNGPRAGDDFRMGGFAQSPQSDEQASPGNESISGVDRVQAVAQVHGLHPEGRHRIVIDGIVYDHDPDVANPDNNPQHGISQYASNLPSNRDNGLG